MRPFREKKYHPQYRPGATKPTLEEATDSDQKIVRIRESGATQASAGGALPTPDAGTQSKVVEANQKAVDALPLDSGTWRVEGVPGLYVRCRKQSKSFMLQRRVRGQLVKETLGELSMKRARQEAMRVWTNLKPKPAASDVVTLEAAVLSYIEDRKLAGEMSPKTEANYRYNLNRYLTEWKGRDLYSIGNDRAGVRHLQRTITRMHGQATANQVIRLLSAVYRWRREEDPLLPEPPTTAVKVHGIKPRDWAYSPEELRAWWHDVKEDPDRKKLIELGVKTLGPMKRMWWLTALLTGARKGSIEALRWADVDLEKKAIHFRVAKGDRPYAVPASDRLCELLKDYRDSGDVPPSEWLFPSNVRDGQHIVNVKNDAEGAGPAHRLRHSFRTALAELGATPDQARLLMGHSLGGDVSRGYITPTLLLESLRPIANGVAERYALILGWQPDASASA